MVNSITQMWQSILQFLSPIGTPLLLAFFAGIGFAIGWLFHKISVFLIEKKSADSDKIAKAKQKSSKLVYGGISALGFSIISIIIPNSMARYETMVLFSICLSIGWIDWMIRKIPNELLLSLIVTKAVFLIYDGQPELLIQGFIGFAVGFIVFSLPSLLRIPIGAGDVKYAAVVGFYFGVYSFIEVMVVMAVGLAIYLLYLLITKKGNMRTSAAMGPYISLGILFTALFPLI